MIEQEKSKRYEAQKLASNARTVSDTFSCQMLRYKAQASGTM